MSTPPALDILPANPTPADVCCAPLLREPITASQARDMARLLKALADPTRLRLVSMVAAAGEGSEACVCDLTAPLGLTQPTISHHLKILVDAGIFSRDKRGVWAYYSLVPAALDALSVVLRTTR
jgi:ArsR family transcriptional regulator, arsenate/arsenite/antimonite-responsive transcriptional repressor